MQSSGQRFVGANIVNDRITGELCMCARHACDAMRGDTGARVGYIIR